MLPSHSDKQWLFANMKVLRLLVFAGLAIVSLAANAAEFEDEEESLMEALRSTQVQESDSSDFLRACGVTFPPDENEINTCLEDERAKECPYFDTSDCMRPECLLGYEKDENGCVVSCECQQEGLFEGDIMVKRDQLPYFREAYGFESLERGASRNLRRWDTIKDAGYYIVPYVLTSGVKNRRTLSAIKAAMAQYEKDTCIRFRPRTKERDYIRFIFGRGCYSYLGRTTGAQDLSLGKYCWYKGIAMHEMMHAMGFFHEHSRPDRDDFVTVINSNIKPEAAYNFRKMTKRDIDSMGSPYDIRSLMHYGGYDFSISRNRLATIVSKRTGAVVKKQRNGFTSEDLKQLNLMYRCK